METILTEQQVIYFLKIRQNMNNLTTKYDQLELEDFAKNAKSSFAKFLYIFRDRH